LAAPVAETGKHLVVCMAEEPEGLYFYGEPSLAKTHVLHGLYDDMVFTQDFGYQANGIVKLPSLTDGDAVINEVEVDEGDRVVDAEGNAADLEPGLVLKDAEGNRFAYGGGPVTLPQMVVDFRLQPMVWEDGVPVTARDSVYSFELARDANTPVANAAVARTASYAATGDLTVRWTGLPGWLDATYFLNVYEPLPEHVWGEMRAAELVEAEVANLTPLASGPFRIQEWVAGDYLTLVPNGHYWREGRPVVDSVTYRFIADENRLLAEMLAGACDIGTQDGVALGLSPFLIEAQARGLLSPTFQIEPRYEQIVFGVNPGRGYAESRPDWFEDARVRQAMTMCTDRQGMVRSFLYGRSQVMDAYVPRVHPLYPEGGVAAYGYDPEAANALLDEVGFVDSDEDGVREYYASSEVAGANFNWNGTPFTVTLTISDDGDLRAQLAEMFKANQATCGIGVVIEALPRAELFADSPDGVLTRRQFDLVGFEQEIAMEPACGDYVSRNIPGPAENVDAQGEPLYAQGWEGRNVSGYSNEAFDEACRAAQGAFVGSAAYGENHQEALRIFEEELPAMPLFAYLKVAAARPGLRNFGLNPTQESELYNLYEIDRGGS
jgi:peptide/nickel transport system substrate-binding protein